MFVETECVLLNSVKATSGGLNANFLISCWPPLVALTILCWTIITLWAWNMMVSSDFLYMIDSPPLFFLSNGFSIVISIDSLVIKKECKCVQTPCWTPLVPLTDCGTSKVPPDLRGLLEVWKVTFHTTQSRAFPLILGSAWRFNTNTNGNETAFVRNGEDCNSNA